VNSAQLNLEGKTALVTGGGRGIGRATALALAGCGARVLVAARGEGEIRAVAGEIQEAGGDAVAVAADIGREDDVHRLFAQIGAVDILINNAGIIGPIAPLWDATPSDWLENIAINLHGVFFTCRHALTGMIERDWGRIVNVSSGAARGTTAGWSAYSAAKAGVEALTGVLAREVAGRDIRVNAVRPGIVDTEMQVQIRSSSEEQFTRENVERFRGYQERGLLRTPEDPARLILYLLTREAERLNGEVVSIDDPEIAIRVGLKPMGR